MFNKIFEYLKKPQLYAESSGAFWNDDHISKGMLEAHINPQCDAASRNHTFIDKSVNWIKEIAPYQKYKNVLDLGCGPGIYAERLFQNGYSIIGIDFSKRSIEYAIKKANKNNYKIRYEYENYLNMDFNDEFDLILLIYCDFGVLSCKHREILLQKIYGAMKNEGKFIFDVFTPRNYEGKGESNTWNLIEGNGFWKPETHICLESHYIYEDNIRLNQYVIIDKNEKVDVFRVWDHYYTKETIIDEIKKIGFKSIEIYSDVSGKPYDEKSKTMCIVAEK